MRNYWWLWCMYVMHIALITYMTLLYVCVTATPGKLDILTPVHVTTFTDTCMLFEQLQLATFTI